LRAKADGQADYGSARKIGRQVYAEFLQDQPEREKIDGKDDSADDEAVDRISFGF
jgi:hypothetical protein